MATVLSTSWNKCVLIMSNGADVSVSRQRVWRNPLRPCGCLRCTCRLLVSQGRISCQSNLREQPLLLASVTLNALSQLWASRDARRCPFWILHEVFFRECSVVYKWQLCLERARMILDCHSLKGNEPLIVKIPYVCCVHDFRSHKEHATERSERLYPVERGRASRLASGGQMRRLGVADQA